MTGSMGWKDDFGRDEIVMHPSLVSGEADWRVETGEDDDASQPPRQPKYPDVDAPVDDVSAERIKRHDERLAPILERKRRERSARGGKQQ